MLRGFQSMTNCKALLQQQCQRRCTLHAIHLPHTLSNLVMCARGIARFDSTHAPNNENNQIGVVVMNRQEEAAENKQYEHHHHHHQQQHHHHHHPLYRRSLRPQTITHALDKELVAHFNSGHFEKALDLFMEEFKLIKGRHLATILSRCGDAYPMTIKRLKAQPPINRLIEFVTDRFASDPGFVRPDQLGVMLLGIANMAAKELHVTPKLHNQKHSRRLRDRILFEAVDHHAEIVLQTSNASEIAVIMAAVVQFGVPSPNLIRALETNATRFVKKGSFADVVSIVSSFASLAPAVRHAQSPYTTSNLLTAVHVHGKKLVEKCTAQEVADLVMAFATLQVPAPNVINAFKLKHNAEWHVTNGDAHTVGTVMRALAKLRAPVPNLFTTVEANAEFLVNDSDAQSLANMLWACATLGGRSPKVGLHNKLFECAEQRGAAAILDTAAPHDVSNILWAFATHGLLEPTPTSTSTRKRTRARARAHTRTPTSSQDSTDDRKTTTTPAPPLPQLPTSTATAPTTTNNNTDTTTTTSSSSSFTSTSNNNDNDNTIDTTTTIPQHRIEFLAELWNWLLKEAGNKRLARIPKKYGKNKQTIFPKRGCSKAVFCQMYHFVAISHIALSPRGLKAPFNAPNAVVRSRMSWSMGMARTFGGRRANTTVALRAQLEIYNMLEEMGIAIVCGEGPFDNDDNVIEIDMVNKLCPIDMANKENMIAINYLGPDHFLDNNSLSGLTLLKVRLCCDAGWNVFNIPHFVWRSKTTYKQKKAFLLTNWKAHEGHIQTIRNATKPKQTQTKAQTHKQAQTNTNKQKHKQTQTHKQAQTNTNKQKQKHKQTQTKTQAHTQTKTTPTTTNNQSQQHQQNDKQIDINPINVV